MRLHVLLPGCLYMYTFIYTVHAQDEGSGQDPYKIYGPGINPDDLDTFIDEEYSDFEENSVETSVVSTTEQHKVVEEPYVVIPFLEDPYDRYHGVTDGSGVEPTEGPPGDVDGEYDEDEDDMLEGSGNDVDETFIFIDKYEPEDIIPKYVHSKSLVPEEFESSGDDYDNEDEYYFDINIDESDVDIHIGDIGVILPEVTAAEADIPAKPPVATMRPSYPTVILTTSPDNTPKLKTTTPAPLPAQTTHLTTTNVPSDTEAYDFNPTSRYPYVSPFADPELMIAFIGGTVVGLTVAILIVMLIIYQMRKKDEGSYPLDDDDEMDRRKPLTAQDDKDIYA